MSMLVSVFQQHQSSPNTGIPFHTQATNSTVLEKKWCPATQEEENTNSWSDIQQKNSHDLKLNPCKETCGIWSTNLFVCVATNYTLFSSSWSIFCIMVLYSWLLDHSSISRARITGKGCESSLVCAFLQHVKRLRKRCHTTHAHFHNTNVANHGSSDNSSNRMYHPTGFDAALS